MKPSKFNLSWVLQKFLLQKLPVIAMVCHEEFMHLMLQACNLPSIMLPTSQCTATWLICQFLSTLQVLIYVGVEIGGGREPQSGGLQHSLAFFKVKWPTRRCHCTQTVTKYVAIWHIYQHVKYIAMQFVHLTTNNEKHHIQRYM